MITITEAEKKLLDAYGNSYDYATMREAKDQVSDLLGEEPLNNKPRSLHRDLQQAQERYVSKRNTASGFQARRKRKYGCDDL